MARIPVLTLLLSFGLGTAAQQEAVIHQFLFRVAEELTTDHKVDNKSRDWFPGYSTSEPMPQSLIDSIKTRTAEALSKKLGMPVSLCYKETNKNAFIQPSSGPGMIGGLPGLTFKKGKEICPGKFRYVDIGAQITADGGSGVSFGERDKSSLKPKVSVKVTVYDENKEEVWGNKASLKDFKELRSHTRYRGNTEVRTAETLTPYDIYVMFMMTLDMAMQQ